MTSKNTGEAAVTGALPGFGLARDAITPEEEARLIALIEDCNPRSYPGDELGGLRAISFGWSYDLATGAFSPSAPIPEGFLQVRAIAARFAGLQPEELVQCLLNRYERGAEIPWHCDKPIWDDVIGVSLGGATTMRFRKPSNGAYEHAEAWLEPRSIYLMRGEVRSLFDHSIPPMTERRWSITLRTLSAEGRALRDALDRSARGS
jgi:alkylated DNA repair dioxygenase AlkB